MLSVGDQIQVYIAARMISVKLILMPFMNTKVYTEINNLILPFSVLRIYMRIRMLIVGIVAFKYLVQVTVC